jgi:hypothetical protein
MKVVQELVSYFDRRGALAPKELRKLLDQGFLAAEAPQTLLELGDQVGSNFYFRVRGELQGQVWGTDIYTGDSALGVAAVHAGLVKPGETAIVKVSIVAPLTQYQGSIRHGVTTHDFGRYGSAYRLAAI